MRSRDPDRSHRSDGGGGATLNPRLLTLPARFRNATTSCSAGRVIINASQPISPHSAPHLSQPITTTATRQRGYSGSINPFVDLISAADHLTAQDDDDDDDDDFSQQSDSPPPRRTGNKPDKLSGGHTALGMASVETAATTTTTTAAATTSIAPKRLRKLRISLARKAEGVAHILRPRTPQVNILPAHQLCKAEALKKREEAKVALTEARRRWECAIESVRSDVNMAHDVLIPDLTNALEEAERALFVSTLSGLCLQAARQGRAAARRPSTNFNTEDHHDSDSN